MESLSQLVENLREAVDSSESSLEVDQSRKKETTVIKPVNLAFSGRQLLTTGEAYEILGTKGFDKSIGTFRRTLSESLKNGVLKESLIQYGLVAEFEIRQAAKPKDNSVRWLYFP